MISQLFGWRLASGLSLWLTLAELPGGEGGGASFSDFIDSPSICPLFLVATCPWALWPSLAEIPRGRGGASLPLDWLSGSLSLSSRGWGGGGGAFLLYLRAIATYLSIMRVATCPWGWLSGSRSLSSQGGGLPSLISLISHLFVHYFGRHMPVGSLLWPSLAEIPRGGRGLP